MFFIKKTITFLFVVILIGCTSSNFNKISHNNQRSISIYTPNDKDNIIYGHEVPEIIGEKNEETV